MSQQRLRLSSTSCLARVVRNRCMVCQVSWPVGSLMIWNKCVRMNLLSSQLTNLNKGSHEDSGLCASDRETFSTVLRKMCCKHKLLPSSYAIADELERVEKFPSGSGGSAYVFCGWYRGSKVAIKQIRHSPNLARVEKVPLSTHLSFKMRMC